MNHTKLNLAGQPKARCPVTLSAAALGLAALVMLGASANAEDMYQPTGLTAGGIPAQTTINMAVTPTNETFSWYGMRGWSTVLGSTNASGPFTNNIVSTEAAQYAWSVTATNPDPTNNWFFILAQTNYYAGSGACSSCHGDKYAPYSQTLHASALSAIMNPDGSFIGHANASCLPCHTVGDNQPTGYVYTTNSASFTSPLANVGCENCHGPAGWHKNSDHEVIRPAITIAAEMCGGCHTGHNPQYDEWANSPHAAVVPDVASGVSDTISGEKNIMNCGPCHFGAARVALVEDYQNRMNGYNNQFVLPTAHDATNYAQTCAVCHDPHSPTYVSTNIVYATNVLSTTNIFSNYGIYYTNVVYSTNVMSTTSVTKVLYQLRNPMWSSNFFTYFTGAPTQVAAYTNFDGSVTFNTNYLTATFDGQYNPKIQICGQCHNSRGARWDGRGLSWNGSNLVTTAPSFSRPPHNSPQYNILIGILQPDYLNTTNGKTVYTNGIVTNGLGIYATHSGIAPRTPYNTNQCSTCHVPIYAGPAGNVSGHTFQIDPNGCALGGCHNSTSHGTPGAPDYIDYAIENSNLVVSVADLLNTWALTKATNYISLASFNKSLQNSWEYTTPGSLASITNSGPSASDQTNLPAAILQARFDDYMVNNDGTYGVHNPTFVPLLLKDAETKVLSQFTTALFTAKATYAGLMGTITFTNLNPSVTACTWNFGDGGTSTSTATTVTHVYTNAGPYTVSLTATDANGTQTLTRNHYINVYVVPTPSYTYAPVTVTNKVPVIFTNTSVNANYGNWAFYSSPVINATNIVGGKASPVNMAQFFTFTNAGSYTVVFTASSPGGSASVTNIITVN